MFKIFSYGRGCKNIIKEFPEIKLFQLLGLTILMIDLDKANIADRADKTMMIDSYIGENNFNKVKNKKQLGDLYNNLSDITENNFISHMDKIFLGLHKKNIVQIKTIDKDYIKASIYKEVSVDATPFLVFKGLILFKVHYNKNKNNFSISEGLFLFSGGKDKINFRLNEMNYLIPQTKSDLVGAKNFYIHKDGNYPITRTYFENKYKNKDFSLVLEQYINSFFNKNTGYISF